MSPLCCNVCPVQQQGTVARTSKKVSASPFKKCKKYARIPFKNCKKYARITSISLRSDRPRATVEVLLLLLLRFRVVRCVFSLSLARYDSKRSSLEHYNSSAAAATAFSISGSSLSATAGPAGQPQQQQRHESILINKRPRITFTTNNVPRTMYH